MIGWLPRWWAPRVELAPPLAARLQAWRQLPPVDERTAIAEARLLVVDVGTTGLNVRRDRLLAIGAVAVEGGRLNPADGFSVVLKSEERVGRDSIVIHGIGPQAQEAGTDPAEALVAFLEYVGRQPLVAYHAAFDQIMLDRALRATLGVRLPNPWLDLAWLAPALVPEAQLLQAGLDAWLEHFELRVLERHRATADAFVTAELLLVLLARARARGTMTFSALHATADAQARRITGGGVGGV